MAVNKKYILFDLDGTLTDSKEGITKSVQYALRDFGIEVENLDQLSTFIGPPLRESFGKYYHFDENETKRAIIKYREYFSQKGIYENVLYDGIEEMLRALKDAGKILILATSKPTVFAEKILKYFHLRDYFDFISGSELSGGRSSKEDVICYALEQNSISDLEEVIMIGDRKHDVLGAKEFGITSMGVLYGYGEEDELKRAGADIIVDSVDEIIHRLLN